MIVILRNAVEVVLMRMPFSCHSMEVESESDASTWQVSLIGVCEWWGVAVDSRIGVVASRRTATEVIPEINVDKIW